MRTTLVINDELLAEAKKRAADRKSNVSEIVNEALRMALKAESEPVRTRAFQIPTYRPGKAKKTDSRPDELNALMAAEDIEGYGR